MAGRLPVTLGVAAGVLLLDQVTKTVAVATLTDRAPVEVIGSLLRLNLVRNPGAAFSLAGNYTIFISVLAIVVTFFIVRTSRTMTSTWWAVVLGGILGGALGNLTDRLFRAPGPFRGHVVDFLQLPHWPVFNVADMALVGSAILAVGLSIVGVDMGGQPSAGEARAESHDLLTPDDAPTPEGVPTADRPPAADAPRIPADNGGEARPDA